MSAGPHTTRRGAGHVAEASGVARLGDRWALDAASVSAAVASRGRCLSHLVRLRRGEVDAIVMQRAPQIVVAQQAAAAIARRAALLEALKDRGHAMLIYKQTAAIRAARRRRAVAAVAVDSGASDHLFLLCGQPYRVCPYVTHACV